MLETLNKDNALKLKMKTPLRIVRLEEGKTVAIPTKRRLANAFVLDIFPDGAFTAHWDGNFNIFGDFSSELMRFTDNLELDELDLGKRNAFRIKNGLMPIE